MIQHIASVRSSRQVYKSFRNLHNTYTYTHAHPLYTLCLQMERWIQMHYQIKQREQALAIAQHRELFYWLSGFYLSAVYGCASYYQRVKRASVLAPLLPLTFVMGYYTDWAYGSKLHRIQGEYMPQVSFSRVCFHYVGYFLFGHAQPRRT